MSALILAWGILLGAWTLAGMWDFLSRAEELERVLWAFKLALEWLASFYLISNVFKAAAYVLLRARAGSRGGETIPSPTAKRPSVGIVYLCCEDLDVPALESLCRVRYDGPLFLIVHDDSRTREGRERVERTVQALEEAQGRSITLLRRPARTGGKPGAVNYVLDRAGWMFTHFVLCDNDSMALQADFIPRALAYLEDPRVAVVQFRNRGVLAPGAPALHRRLTRAIDAFDVYMRSYARFGMAPFLGHNAMLRTRDVREAGGLTEGVFSDDIDLTLRLAQRGLRVVYSPEIEFGERHPSSYTSFLLRSRKWAYGCMQVLSRHLSAVLGSKVMRLRDKAWFLEFAGFYAVQVMLAPYLLLSYVAVPLAGRMEGAAAGPPPAQTAAFGALVLMAILAPTLALAIADRRLREWPAMAWSCALVYGGSIFSGALGVLDHLRAVVREWVPTNRVHAARGLGRLAAAQAALGAALFVTPLWAAPDLLLAPSSYFFICIFLFSPLVVLAYRPHDSGRSGHRRTADLVPEHEPEQAAVMGVARDAVPPGASALPKGVLLLVALGIAALVTGVRCGGAAAGVEAEDRLEAAAGAEARVEVEIRGDQLFVAGRPFLVRGIHYSPWPPGSGPMKDYEWPGIAALQEDVRRLRELNANTLLVHDAPDGIFDLLESAGLRVIHAFYINWQSIHDEALFSARREEIASRVRALRGRRSVILWLLGNEIPEWVPEKYGRELVTGRLRSLYEAVKLADPDRPAAHANWPPTLELDLSFMDVAAFNLYPLWPREVVVRGYGEYIESVLRPAAGGRPLLITEFGVNTIESDEQRQAQILRECWKEIERRTAGGVVFEFVDEWWKNYDNPIREGEWWQRQYAPEDEKTHDLDPEEHYGIMTSDRSPRPAYAAVREMFAPPRPAMAGSRAWLAAPLIVLLVYTVYVFWRKV